ncbi:MAG: hypothetical protein JST00_43090 [Deltaproteobacteria bacterium]|nr:hypothetical protein [Deltaproteobacteria bacterium]
MSRRVLLTLTAALAPVVAIVACSDETRPGGFGGPTYSGNPGVLNEGGSPVPTPTGEGGVTFEASVVVDAGACTSRAQLCRPFSTPGGDVAGPLNGGTLVQGSYVLVGSTGTDVACHTLHVADGFFHDVETTPGVDGGAPTTVLRSSSFVVSGNGLALTEVCPGKGVVNTNFGFDGTVLTLQTSGAGGRTDVYRKQ